MIRKIISVAGKPGLYKLVSQGRNMLIVESLLDGKRMPVYARDKVISLGDISIYTVDEDIPLAEVLDKVYAKTEGKPVDVKTYKDADLRALFAEILPNFDDDRVYTTDIKKLFSWYNILLSSGMTKFADDEEAKGEEAPAAETTKEA